MKYWIDLEFIEDGKTIDILSVAVVCEDGRYAYYENAEAELDKASDWVKENVIPHLFGKDVAKWATLGSHWGGYGSLGWISRCLLGFCDPAAYGKPEFWGYYSSYDWVAICQMYGPMIAKPDGWPMYCMDIKQLAVSLGNPELPKQSTTEHHALADARWNKEAWEFLEAQR